jgi:hypothetical protein
MATNGTPYEGRDNIIVPAVYTGMQLRLYTNTLNSLSATTVLADLTYPSGTGYAPYTLTGVWSSLNGIVTYDDGTPDNPQFENTGGGNWTGDPTGAALTDGTYLLHFKDFALGAIVMVPGKIIDVDLSTYIP